MGQAPKGEGIYNVVVIGAGTAGLVAAAGTAGLGGRVALVERLGWGFVAVSAGSTLGAAGAFLVARYLARDRVERWAAANPRFAAIDRAVGREGWKIVLLTRLSPVRFGAYVLASWIGMMPGTVLYVYLGFAGRAVAQAAAGPRAPPPSTSPGRSVCSPPWRSPSTSPAWRAGR